MPASLKVSHCLICDDVRLEVSYKETVVGIYISGISVPSLPWFIFVCVWMSVIWSGDGEVSLEIRILDPLFNEIGQSRGHARAIQTGRESALTFRGLACNIESEGNYTIQWRMEHGAWQTIKTVPVMLAKT